MIVQQISAIEPPMCLEKKMLYRLVQCDDLRSGLSLAEMVTTGDASDPATFLRLISAVLLFS